MKASQGLENWLKTIKAIKASVQARYEKKLNFHNFFNWLWLFRPKNSCNALGLTKKGPKRPKRSLQGQIIENCKREVPQFQIWSSNIENSVYKCSKQEIEWDHQKLPFQVQKRVRRFLRFDFRKKVQIQKLWALK